MDLTFTVLKETDIEWNVNRLRKHPSNEVRGLVKQLVRKWKDLVDEWVGSNNSALARSTLQVMVLIYFCSVSYIILSIKM
ncbi:putative transcription regulator IWS1 family [Helianthus annuus]|nr:putative transcription regulator IWS1 family [Helianthus annuus]